MFASLEKTFELQKRLAGSSCGQYEKGRDRAGAVAQLVEDLSNMMKPWVPDIAPHTTGHCSTHVILEPSEGGGRRIESSRLSSGYIMNYRRLHKKTQLHKQDRCQVQELPSVVLATQEAEAEGSLDCVQSISRSDNRGSGDRCWRWWGCT